MKQQVYNRNTDKPQSPSGFYDHYAKQGWWPRLFGAHLLMSQSKFKTTITREQFIEYLHNNLCLYRTVRRDTDYDIEKSVLSLVAKSLDEWLWIESDLLVNAMPSTPERKMNNDKFEKSLQTSKANKLADASRATLEQVQNSLTAEQMVEYSNIKSIVLEMVHSGRLKNFTELDIERYTLMKMIESRGLVDMLQSSTETLTREALTYFELVRKFGESSQKMMDEKEQTQKSAKSAFSELADLARDGVRVTLDKPETAKIIDADWNPLLDEEE